MGLGQASRGLTTYRLHIAVVSSTRLGRGHCLHLSAKVRVTLPLRQVQADGAMDECSSDPALQLQDGWIWKIVSVSYLIIELNFGNRTQQLTNKALITFGMVLTPYKRVEKNNTDIVASTLSALWEREKASYGHERIPVISFTASCNTCSIKIWLVLLLSKHSPNTINIEKASSLVNGIFARQQNTPSWIRYKTD
ncbi:hypothetical protein J6590_078279 [Homalodisca vitripennis]|nr:hypothetical protein J6590_078279 [Homalodisca vitripennis]